MPLFKRYSYVCVLENVVESFADNSFCMARTFESTSSGNRIATKNLDGDVAFLLFVCAIIVCLLFYGLVNQYNKRVD